MPARFPDTLVDSLVDIRILPNRGANAARHAGDGPSNLEPPEPQRMDSYLPISILFLVATAAAALLLWTGHVLGPNRPGSVKSTPYESGDDPFGKARIRLTIPFFRLAILFLVFEAAAVLVLVWCTGVRSAGATRETLAIALAVFLGLVGIGYLYASRKGALDWE